MLPCSLQFVILFEISLEFIKTFQIWFSNNCQLSNCRSMTREIPPKLPNLCSNLPWWPLTLRRQPGRGDWEDACVTWYTTDYNSCCISNCQEQLLLNVSIDRMEGKLDGFASQKCASSDRTMVTQHLFLCRSPNERNAQSVLVCADWLIHQSVAKLLLLRSLGAWLWFKTYNQWL